MSADHQDGRILENTNENGVRPPHEDTGGIGIKFLREWDIKVDPRPQRLDVWTMSADEPLEVALNAFLARLSVKQDLHGPECVQNGGDPRRDGA